MRSSCFAFVVILMNVPLGSIGADDRQVEALRDVKSRVATAEESPGLAGQVRDNLRARLQQANERSSADWKSIQTRDDWIRFREEKMRSLKASLGNGTPADNELRMEITKEIVGKNFRVQNVLFESRPGWWVSANLYCPGTQKDSMPGIVICHSHHTPKHHAELQDMGMSWANAGCYVLIPDQIGHGERRQHPFASASDYVKPFGVNRQDYYFRYDNAIRLHLVGESLMGWMVWDLMKSADVLLKQKGIDPARILLLGSVAGGGDPAAVAGALDDRFTAVVPFNFGGPQPETRFPLPDDIEFTFNYAGSGGWESTRNLQASARQGFLPWVIVGSIAPRRLIYAHEFRWDKDRDPVWKRLREIYDLYGAGESLDYTQGYGELKGKPPEASHCTHIGSAHRVRIHQAFAKWFGIDVTEGTEVSPPMDSSQLNCWTPEARQRLSSRTLSEITTDLADQHLANRRRERQGQTADKARELLQNRWEKLLGGVACEKLKVAKKQSDVAGVPGGEAWMLVAESGIQIPCLLFKSNKPSLHKQIVLILCSQGKSRLLRERAPEIAALLNGGATVCLTDPRGLGESHLGESHTRRSDATSHSSTGLMLGKPLLGEQISDVRMVLGWLRRRLDGGFRPIVLWGESLIAPNPETSSFRIPRDDDFALPPVSEPQAPLVALLTGLFEDDLDGIYTRGGIVNWRCLLSSHLVLTAHDIIVPGALTAGDLSDIVATQPSGMRIRMDCLVDGWNRRASDQSIQELCEAASGRCVADESGGIVDWILKTK